MKAIAIVVLLALWPGCALATCKPITTGGNNYILCSIDVHSERIEMFDTNISGQVYGGFGPLVQDLASQGKRLSFGMNAGMFGTDLKPIGLYVEHGKMLHRLNRSNGSGNFNLKPNGVFFVSTSKAGVMDTDTYAHSGLKPEFATQSGPMLVINGAIHPRFSPTGTSTKIRNGVCVPDDHSVQFLISDWYVTFYEFALAFRDTLNCRNALFLDGSVSSLYAPEMGRNDFLAQLGPMVGVTAPAK